jgi:hypothetical protein
MERGTLYRVVNRYFVAGFVADEKGRIVRCAPILQRHVKGLFADAAVLRLRHVMGWSVERL